MNRISHLYLASRSTRKEIPHRVLVVEDYPDLARLMTVFMRNLGIEVQAVTSGLMALPMARAFRPEFVLLDIGLPGIDGYQVARLIRSDPDLRDTLIIAISAYGPDAHPQRSRRGDFDYHLTKPVSMDDIVPLMVPRRS